MCGFHTVRCKRAGRVGSYAVNRADNGRRRKGRCSPFVVIPISSAGYTREVLRGERPMVALIASGEGRGRVHGGNRAWRVFPRWAGPPGVAGTRACFAGFWQGRRSWGVAEEFLFNTAVISKVQSCCESVWIFQDRFVQFFRVAALRVRRPIVRFESRLGRTSPKRGNPFAWNQ